MLIMKKDLLRQVMSELGKKGGKKGGRSRMASMNAQQRSELAKKAAAARWKKKPPKGE
jgi:hypothetical protein